MSKRASGLKVSSSWTMTVPQAARVTCCLANHNVDHFKRRCLGFWPELASRIQAVAKTQLNYWPSNETILTLRGAERSTLLFCV